MSEKFGHLTAISATDKILKAILNNQGDVNLGDVNLSVDDLENLLQGIGGSVETPSVDIVTNATTLAAGASSISITNTGAIAGTVAGSAIAVGETFEFSSKVGNTLGSLAYVATGTSFLILRTTIV